MTTLAEQRGIEEEFWRRGELQYLLREHGQTRAYLWTKKWIEDHPDDCGPVIEICHRRFGKSYGKIVFGIERCLSAPGHECRYGAPTGKQCSEIVRPLMRQILAHCPSYMRPTKAGDRWTFHNPSWEDKEATSSFTLFSCKDEADQQRGKATDTLILDEARDIMNLSYVVLDVFGWQFVDRKMPVINIITTPPKLEASPIKHKFVDPAVKEERYLCIPTHENLDWKERDDKMLSKLVGGKDSVPWRREAGCEFIYDTEVLILPEFSQHESKIVVGNIERPDYYFPYVFLDTAWSDFTAVLFAYVDFLAQRLVVLDEIQVKNTTTGDLAEMIKTREAEVFRNSYHPVRRMGDFTLQQLNDLRKSYGLAVRPADKWDRDSAIAYLRTSIQRDKIRIHERCKKLIHQARSGIKDDHGEFVRIEEDEDMGHCDGVAALVYGHRMVNWSQNPFVEVQQRIFGTFYSPKAEEPGKAGGVVITHNPIHITRQSVRR